MPGGGPGQRAALRTLLATGVVMRGADARAVPRANTRGAASARPARRRIGIRGPHVGAYISCVQAHALTLER